MQTGRRLWLGATSLKDQVEPNQHVKREVKGALAEVRTEFAKGGFERLWQHPSLADDRHEV